MLINFEDISLEWAKKCNVSRENYYGSLSFAGNSCKKLLENVDLLRQLCTSKCCFPCLKYVRCYNDFNKVVDSCFFSNLEPDYIESINKFKESYLDLGISVTPKVHTVFFS